MLFDKLNEGKIMKTWNGKTENGFEYHAEMDDTGLLKINIEGQLYERSFSDLAFIVGQAAFSLARVMSRRFGLSIQESLSIVRMSASYKVWELRKGHEKNSR